MKHLTMIIATLGLAAALLTGCKGQDDKVAAGDQPAAGGKVASCDVISMGQSCKQYNAANLALGTDSLRSLCEAVKGRFADAPCPADKHVGVCAKPEGTDVFYEGYPIELAHVEADCKSSEGTWTKK